MAGQQLTTTILINARTGNGFQQVGATLTELGSLVNGISDRLIGFGEDSVKVYRDYEKSMADAEVALSTIYGRNTQELSRVMGKLDEAATEWAATTIFHTDDVANAVAEASHAGWDFDRIMTGIPAAMQLAQAGSLDLSEAVDYIVKSTNAAGISFEETGEFIDHWTYAANSSATTIDEMGEAMLKMGNTMKFAGDSDQLLVVLAELANAGTTGAAAGTLARNSMLRLIAPTKKAREAMAELGATSEETEEILNDESLAAANARLAATGFSAYDEEGNLKGMLETYSDLYVALGEIAGGYDKIADNQDALDIISAIFPTRSITGALALIEAAGEGYHGLYEELQGGSAEGYGGYAAETMMDTLNGKILTFESKVERLKQLVGEELSGQLETVLGTAGGIVDAIAGLDEDTLGALVSGLEVIAAAGPGLLLAGGAMRFIGSVLALGTAGKIMLAAVAVGALAAALDRLEEARYEDNFGDMELDSSQISTYISGLGSVFDENRSKITEFNEALEQAVSDYQTTAETFSSNLLADQLTGDEIDTDAYYSMGEKIGQALQDGIDANFSGVMASINSSFGSDNPEDVDNPIWAQIVDVVSQGYEEEKARAESLSQQLRDAMTSAFADGSLTGEERQNIQSILDEQNELMAKQQDRMYAQERARILQKSQRLGLKSLEESAGLAIEERDREMESLAADQAGTWFDVESFYDEAIEKGWTDQNGRRYTQEDKDAALAELSARQTEEMRSYEAGFSDFLLGVHTAAIEGSDMSGAWGALQTLAGSFGEGGGILTQGAIDAFNASVDRGKLGDLETFMDTMVSGLGGMEEIEGMRDYYYGTGNAAQAQQYQMIADMYTLIKNNGDLMGQLESGAFRETQASDDGGRSAFEKLMAEGMIGFSPESLAEEMASWSQMGENIEQSLKGYFGTNYGAVQDIALANGAADVTSFIEGMYPVTIPVEPEMDTEALENQPPVPIQVLPMIEAASMGLQGAEALTAMGADVSVSGDTQELHAAIQGEDGQNLMSYVSGDATDLHMSIYEEDGQTLIENVAGDTTQLAAAIDAYRNQTIVVNLVGQKMFAAGGRADTASVFGEAGPEWAIPEEHSERTASLLNAARAASGFTWGDLLMRFGGLNANPETEPTTIIYSPTINANDASGVDEVLRQDKARLDKWYREMQMRDRAEVYA